MAKAPAIPIGAPVVVLHGEERFLHLEHTRLLRDALKKAHGEVDVVVFDGATASPADVLDECRSLGLMVTHKLVIVDAADDLLKAKGEDGEADAPAPAAVALGRAGKSARELFEAYCASPEPAATLLLRAESWLTKTKLHAAILSAGGAAVECAPLGDGEAARWAIECARAAHGVTLNPDAAGRLVAAIGTDMARLDSEIGKLSLTLLAGAQGAGGGGGQPSGPITLALVNEMVGESREDEAWSLQQAVLSGDPARAMADLHRALEIARHNPVLVNIVYLDLCKKLDGLCRGAPIRLWGASASAIQGASRALGPLTTARMLNTAVQADVKLKSGQADPVRLMESVTLQFASRLGR